MAHAGENIKKDLEMVKRTTKTTNLFFTYYFSTIFVASLYVTVLVTKNK